MTTWLVTGGAGFIGGNFVLDAVRRGIRIVNLDALTYAGNRDTLAPLDGNPDHVFVHGDMLTHTGVTLFHSVVGLLLGRQLRIGIGRP